MHAAATAPAENDFALLDRFASSGDQEAFAEIVKRYAGVVYATSFRVCHDRGRAEDVAQEVFFKLLRRPHSVSQSLGGWLHQCATRLALDEVRSETARRRREANRRIELNDLGDPQATTWAEISPHVDEALATLPDESRELLVSHFLQGKSQNQIAVDTRTSPATISRRMRDAVAALRAELRRRGVVVAPALLIGLCRMNAPAQASTVPATLTTELGKMAMVGKPAASVGGGAGGTPSVSAGGEPFAWSSVSSWCDAAARTWGWPAEVVKQSVAAAAAAAVALVAALLLVQTLVAPPTQPNGHSSPSAATVMDEARVAAARTASPAPSGDVRVTPASERDPRVIVLFTWPDTASGPMALTYGDGRSVKLPQPLARKFIENQAGKTLEQLADESRKQSFP